MLRITDVLLENAVAEAQEMDCEAGQSGEVNGAHVQKLSLELCVLGMGVSI